MTTPRTPPRWLGEGFRMPLAGRVAGLALPLALALLVAACISSGQIRPTIPPDATASSVPAETGTPAPSASRRPAATFPLSLIDDEDTLVAVKAPPRTIVSLTPATTEILFAIGAGDRVVAKVEDVAPYPPEANDLPIVARFGTVDVERIVSLGADLVLAGGNGFNPPEAIAQLRRVGVPVLVVYATSIAGVVHDIELIGDAVGAGPAAGDLATSMRAGFDQVAAATRDLPKPRTFYELDASNGIFGPAKDSLYAEMIGLAGGTPITTDDPAVFSISLEKLVAADPEVIVLGDAAYGVTPQVVAARAGWQTMSAVKAGSIRPANDVLITRPGPRLVEGLRDLALAIHPELETILPAPSSVVTPAGPSLLP